MNFYHAMHSTESDRQSKPGANWLLADDQPLQPGPDGTVRLVNDLQPAIDAFAAEHPDQDMVTVRKVIMPKANVRSVGDGWYVHDGPIAAEFLRDRYIRKLNR